MHFQSDCNWMQRSLWTKPKRRSKRRYVNKRQWEQLLKGTVKGLDQLRQRKGFRTQWNQPSLIANAVGEANTLVRNALATCHTCQKKGHYKCFSKNVSELESGNEMDAAYLDTVSNSRLADTRLRWTQERRSQ